jgi:hypothetical protein
VQGGEFLFHKLGVFFLKNSGVLAFFIRLRVIAVFGDFINEEQGKNLDALGVQAAFFIQMRFDALRGLTLY